MRTYMAAVVMAGLLVGCGGGDSGGNSTPTVTVHCLFTGDICEDITAVMTSTQQGELDTACTNGGGVFGTGSCPLAGAVAGHCHYTGATVEAITTVPITGATANEYYYTAGDWTPASAQAFCESPPAGTWVP